MKKTNSEDHNIASNTSYSDTEFINAIQQQDGMAGTSDVAEVVGCTRRTAYTRLQALETTEEVDSRKIGNSLVWTVSE